ncbi:MAG TPA: AAA family ATPase [Candidatus Acidoferrales bacterium]|nr:AAA family ATPase [Candidatus Acidoferrales bacterium]
MSVLGKKNDARRGALKVHLVGEAEEQRAEVKANLAAMGDPALDIWEIEPDLTAAQDPSVDVTMVVFNGNDELSLSYLNNQAGQDPRPVLFALLHDRSPELMKRVLRAGADELLFLPLDPGDATRALLKISEARRREEVHGGGMIVSLVSLIGGTGVTSLAANLGLALRYAFDKRVAVVDLDLQTGGMSVFLNLEPERTIMALTEGARKLDSIQLESALSKHASGIYLLAAPKRIEDSELVNDATVGAILDLMRQLFDFVIVDCGTHVDANTVAAWERSNHLFYVLDQSIGAARCAWRFVDLCGRLGLSGVEPNFILSRFVTGHPISEDQLSHTLAKPLFTRIPRDEKVLERVQLSAQDLWQVAPNSPLAKSVEDLARRLEVGVEATTGDSANSLVSRLLLAIGARA